MRILDFRLPILDLQHTSTILIAEQDNTTI